MSEIITVSEYRDIGTVTTEILMIRQQVNQVALNGAIEIGRRLVEAKGMLPHGEWGSWLREKVEFSQSSAQNFMRLFEEYGDAQITMFGAVSKSQALGNLPFTKALKLLAIPAEERESFAEEVNAAELSTRELEKAIRERNAAQAELADVSQRLGETTALLEEAQRDLDATDEDIRIAREEEQQKARKDLDSAMEKLRSAESIASSSKARAETAEKQAEDLRLKLDKAQTKEKLARQELKKLRENPEIPEDALAKIRREAEEAAAKSAAETAEKEKAELVRAREQAEAAASAAKQEARRAEEQLEASRKQLALSNPDAAVFATLLSQFQDGWNKLHGCFLKIKATDPELSAKLKQAVDAQIDIYAKAVWE